MSFYYSFLDKEYQEQLNKDRERMLDLYCSYLEIETEKIKRPRKHYRNYINKTIKRNRLKKGVTKMNKDIVEEEVEVNMLGLLDNPNQKISTLLVKILEFNESLMINWAELDMLLSIVNAQGNRDIKMGMFKVRKILEEVSEKVEKKIKIIA